mgnify:CR=1 FL=1
MKPMNHKRFLRIIIIVLATYSLAGCFSFSFWFERLDTLAIWKLDEMFELSSQQENIVRPDIIEFREWLRTESIPEVSKELVLVKNLWDSGRHEKALTTLEHRSRQLFDQALIYSWPKVARLLSYLTRENAYAYQQWAEERMDDWYAETQSLDAKLEDRTEKLEEWFGKLSPRPLAIVSKYTKFHPDERIIRINNSQQRRQRFLSMAIEGDWQRLEEAYKNPVMLQSRAYKRWREGERSQLEGLLRALLPTLSTNQADYVSTTLDDWITRLDSVTENQPPETS